MGVGIRDGGALPAVSPSALSAYARSAGWQRQEPYRVHLDVYVGEDRPQIIVPGTEHLGDYAGVMATLEVRAARPRALNGQRSSTMQSRAGVLQLTEQLSTRVSSQSGRRQV